MTRLPLTKRSGLLTSTPLDPGGGGLILKCLLISTQISNHPYILPSRAKYLTKLDLEGPDYSSPHFLGIQSKVTKIHLLVRHADPSRERRGSERASWRVLEGCPQ